MTQTVLAKVGSAETTVDQNYDAHCHHFDTMIADMNECGAALHSYLMKQKQMFSDGEELAKSLARIFDHNLKLTDWPDVDCELKQCHVADQYKEKMEVLQNVIRSSASTVCSEHALDPLRACIARVVPEVEALKVEREVKVTDYDSYRRRLKEKETKKEQLDAAGKGETPAGAELVAEIEKFQKKVQAGLEEYTHVNQKTKTDIVEAKRQHDQLMDQLIITTIVCQAEMFANAAAQLEAIIELIPEDKVLAVREKIQEYVRQGGVKPAPAPEKTKFMKGLDVFTGKAPLPDLGLGKSTSPSGTATAHAEPIPAAPAQARPLSTDSGYSPAAPPSAPPAPAATAFTAAKANPFASGDPFSEDAPTTTASSSNPFGGPATAPAPAPVVSVSGTSANLVEALYDHEAEEPDELSFPAGAMVEVIDRSDGGWWRGRYDGREGLFPSNYVRN